MSLRDGEALVCRFNNVDGAMVPAAGFHMPVHDEGNRHAFIEVIQHEGAARSAPTRYPVALDSLSKDGLERGGIQCVSHAPSDCIVEYKVGVIRLLLQDAFA